MKKEFEEYKEFQEFQEYKKRSQESESRSQEALGSARDGRETTFRSRENRGSRLPNTLTSSDS